MCITSHGLEFELFFWALLGRSSCFSVVFVVRCSYSPLSMYSSAGRHLIDELNIFFPFRLSNHLLAQLLFLSCFCFSEGIFLDLRRPVRCFEPVLRCHHHCREKIEHSFTRPQPLLLLLLRLPAPVRQRFARFRPPRPPAPARPLFQRFFVWYYIPRICMLPIPGM